MLAIPCMFCVAEFVEQAWFLKVQNLDLSSCDLAWDVILHAAAAQLDISQLFLANCDHHLQLVYFYRPIKERLL